MSNPGTRIRPGTAFLTLAILVLALLAAAEQRRETRLKAALARFQNRAHARIYSSLNEPLIEAGNSPWLPLNGGNSASLETVVDQLAVLTNRSLFTGFRRGLTVEVDPDGLAEAGQSLDSIILLPPAPTNDLSVFELLTQILEPIELGCLVRDRTLLVTSRKALDRAHERIRERLEKSIILKWSAHDSLEDVVEKVRLQTQGPSFPQGLPIFVQLDGPKAPVDRLELPAPAADALSIREQLSRIAAPLGLRYEIKEGAVMIVTETKANQRN